MNNELFEIKIVLLVIIQFQYFVVIEISDNL